jgi:hypothetical protein
MTDQKKNKREASSDSTSSDTKQIKISHPLSNVHRTKHVSLDELPIKMQKLIESAMSDAILKGKANDGDFLKFYYGDKVIKVPVTISKYLTLKAKETQPSKTAAHDLSAGKKTVKFLREDVVAEPPQLLGTKNTYFQIKETKIKYDSKPYFLPTQPPTTERATSYFTFDSPKKNVDKFEEIVPQLPAKKSIYFFTNSEPIIQKNSVSSPGPVIFESTTATPASFQFEKHIEHPIVQYANVEKEAIRESIPITEEVNEDHSYIPKDLPIITEHRPLPPPKSYIEFSGNHADSYEENNKNYDFGYVNAHFKRR